MKIFNKVLLACLLSSFVLVASAQGEEDSEELKAEKEKTAILEEQKKQAQARKEIAEALKTAAETEKDAESAAVAAEKEKTLILEEQKKQAEALSTIREKEFEADSDAVLAAKERSALLEEQKKQAEAEKEIAKAELEELTAGVEPSSEPKSGTVEGTVKTYIPQLLVYESLDFLAKNIAGDLSTQVNGKSVMLSSGSSRSKDSLVAIQASSFLEELNISLDARINENDGLIGDENASVVNTNDDLSTARSGVIPGLAAADTAISMAADIAGLFKSDYKALEVTVNADQAALDAVLAKRLREKGATVIDIANISFGSSDAVTNFQNLSNGITRLKHSFGKLMVVVDLLKSEQEQKSREQKEVAELLGKLKDDQEREKHALKDQMGNIYAKKAGLAAKVRALEFAKAESEVLKTAAEDFANQLVEKPDSGLSVFMNMVLHEKRKEVDFVLDAAVVGSGGEGYIDQRLFTSTKLSVISGVNVRFELINKNGEVVGAGMESKAFAADYKIRKPEKIKVEEVKITEITAISNEKVLSGAVPKKR